MAKKSSDISFEAFLEEEGILEEIDEAAVKKVLAWQSEQQVPE